MSLEIRHFELAESYLDGKEMILMCHVAFFEDANLAIASLTNGKGLIYSLADRKSGVHTLCRQSPGAQKPQRLAALAVTMFRISVRYRDAAEPDRSAWLWAAAALDFLLIVE